jgi:hypothetical protein
MLSLSCQELQRTKLPLESRIVGMRGEAKMKRTSIFLLFGLVIGYLLHSTWIVASPQGKTPNSPTSTTEFFSDLGKGHWNANAAWFNKVDWVDKQCRTWAEDGDIDVDQTCLVVKNVSGSVSIIPNQYNDGWSGEIKAEMARPLATRDKWIKRFLEVRGW